MRGKTAKQLRRIATATAKTHDPIPYRSIKREWNRDGLKKAILDARKGRPHEEP